MIIFNEKSEIQLIICMIMLNRSSGRIFNPSRYTGCNFYPDKNILLITHYADRDAVSRTANVERTGRHKWDKYESSVNKT